MAHGIWGRETTTIDPGTAAGRDAGRSVARAAEG
jgi:hypothetical protein